MNEETYHLTINGVPKCQFKHRLSERDTNRAKKFLAALGKRFVCQFKNISSVEEKQEIENAVRLALPGAAIELVPGYHEKKGGFWGK